MRCETAPPLQRHNTQPGSIAAVQARGWACDRSIDSSDRPIDRWSSRCRARASLSWLAYAACTHRAWRSCGLSFVTTRGGAPVIKIDPRAAFEQLVHLLLHLCRRVAVAHHIAPKGHPLVVGNLT